MASPLQDLITQVTNLATDIGNALRIRGFKAGGTAGQVPVKTDGTDFNWSWGDAAESVTVDSTVIDGSANAVSGNAVFVALAAKAPATGIAPSAITGTAVTLSGTQIITGYKIFPSVTIAGAVFSGQFDNGLEQLTDNRGYAIPDGDGTLALTDQADGKVNLATSVTGELPPANLQGGATGKSLLAAANVATAWTALGGTGTAESPSFTGGVSSFGDATAQATTKAALGQTAVTLTHPAQVLNPNWTHSGGGVYVSAAGNATGYNGIEFTSLTLEANATYLVKFRVTARTSGQLGVGFGNSGSGTGGGTKINALATGSFVGQQGMIGFYQSSDVAKLVIRCENGFVGTISNISITKLPF